ncbi:MAG: NAD(P)H-dependent oxidoreductase [Polyangiaceae bacterium]|nr:NAD(P)H-dependent oxidoreductase [Polyangiaceae bacterium]
MRILALCGSLRAQSTNLSLLTAAQELAGASLHIYRDLGALPHYNADVEEAGIPDPVAALRKYVRDASVVVISSPEYARGVPGSLKNALDWLVGGPEFYAKPYALWSASDRAVNVDAALRLTLDTMSGRRVEAGCLTVPLLGKRPTAAEILAAPAARRALEAALVALRT